MSSLLSGIRFIPREKKEAAPADSAGGDASAGSGSEHGRKKKRSKKDSKSKSKEHKKKSVKSKHERKSRTKTEHRVLEYSSGAARPKANRRSRSDSSSDSDASDGSRDSRTAKDSGLSMQQRDFERFSSAISGAEFYSSGGSEDERDAWGGRVVKPLLRQDTDSAAPRPAAAAVGASAVATAQSGEDKNQSVAALLRAKLRASKDGLQPTAASSAAVTVVDTDPYSIAKRLLLSRKRNKEAGEDDLSQLAKKRRSASAHGPDSAAPAQGSLTQQDMFALKADERWNEKSMDDVFVSNVLRLGDNYKGTELGGSGMRTEGQTGFDEEDEIDMKMFQASEDRFSVAEQAARDRQRSVREQVRLDGVLSRCSRCTTSARHEKQLTVSVGEHAYLRVKPSHLSFVPWGQCEIVPIAHSSSVLRAGNDALVEIARYKACLERMFEREGKTVVYLESAVRQKSVVRGKNKPGSGAPVDNAPPSDLTRHSVIDAIPVKEGELKAVMSYFRESFLQCDVEWSTHKKLIDLSGVTGGTYSLGPLHKKVPSHMNYVSVEWPGGGFAHVVEDEELFNDDFCLDIMSGFFEDLPFHMKRRQKADTSEDSKNVSKFKESWAAFDWVAYALAEENN